MRGVRLSIVVVALWAATLPAHAGPGTRLGGEAGGGSVEGDVARAAGMGGLGGPDARGGHVGPADAVGTGGAGGLPGLPGPPSPPGPPGPPADSARAIDQVQGIVDAFMAGISSLARGSTPTGAALKALGQRIAVSLFLLIVGWSVVKGWVLGKGLQQLLPDLIQPLVVLGLAWWAVDGLAPPIEASVLAIGDTVAGAVGAEHALNETGLLTSLGVSGLELLMTPVAVGLHPLDWLVGKAACLGAALVLLLCGVIGAGLMIVAKFQTALAILLAPVFIPWAMWAPTSFLFNTWLNFLIAGAMTQTMVAVVAAMSTAGIERMSAVVAGYAGQQVSLVAFGALFLGATLIGYLFLSVPRLAAGLVGGAALGIQGWSAAAQAVGRGMSATGSAAHGYAHLSLRSADAGMTAVRTGEARRDTGASLSQATRAGVRAGWERWKAWDAMSLVGGVGAMVDDATPAERGGRQPARSPSQAAGTPGAPRRAPAGASPAKALPPPSQRGRKHAP